MRGSERRRYTCICTDDSCKLKEDRYRDIVKHISSRHCPIDCEWRRQEISRDSNDKSPCVDHVLSLIRDNKEYPYGWDRTRTIQEYKKAVLAKNKRIPKKAISKDVLTFIGMLKVSHSQELITNCECMFVVESTSLDQSSSQNLSYQDDLDDDAPGEVNGDDGATHEYRPITEYGFGPGGFEPLSTRPNLKLASSSSTSIHSQQQTNLAIPNENNDETDSCVGKRRRQSPDAYEKWRLCSRSSPQTTVTEELPRALRAEEQSHLRPTLPRPTSKRRK